MDTGEAGGGVPWTLGEAGWSLDGQGVGVEFPGTPYTRIAESQREGGSTPWEEDRVVKELQTGLQNRDYNPLVRGTELLLWHSLQGGGSGQIPDHLLLP